MLERMIRAAIAHRWLVLILVLGTSALGVWSYGRLPIDAVPDITNVQVQVNSEAPGYSPLEAEQRVTFPVETALAGMARLKYTRSISRYGLSQVTVVFEDGTDIYCYICAEKAHITTDGIANDESIEIIGSDSEFERTCCICGDSI